jgi:hypothetical protein
MVCRQREVIDRATISRGSRSTIRSGDRLRSTLTIPAIFESWPVSNRGLDRWEGRMSNCLWRIERKRFGAVFSSAVRAPYNKRTIEAGLWGIWAVWPNA